MGRVGRTQKKCVCDLHDGHGGASGCGGANAVGDERSGASAAAEPRPRLACADGIKLARLIAQDKGLSDLVQVEVPKRIVLNAPVVTKDNVEEYKDLCFES